MCSVLRSVIAVSDKSLLISVHGEQGLLDLELVWCDDGCHLEHPLIHRYHLRRHVQPATDIAHDRYKVRLAKFIDSRSRMYVISGSLSIIALIRFSTTSRASAPGT